VIQVTRASSCPSQAAATDRQPVAAHTSSGLRICEYEWLVTRTELNRSLSTTLSSRERTRRRRPGLLPCGRRGGALTTGPDAAGRWWGCLAVGVPGGGVSLGAPTGRPQIGETLRPVLSGDKRGSMLSFPVRLDTGR